MKRLLVSAGLALIVLTGAAFAGMEEAKRLYEEKKWQEAEAEYRKALPELSGEEAAKVQMRIGQLCAIQNRLQDAADEYLKVKGIEGAPEAIVGEAQFNVGMLYYRMGKDKYGEALEVYREVLKMEGARARDKATVQYYTGDILSRQGKYEEAAEELRKVRDIKGAPASLVAESYFTLGIALKKHGKQDEALEAFQKFVAMPEAEGWRKERAEQMIEASKKAE